MSLAGIANALDLTTSALDQLIEGHATDSIASLVGVERSSLDGFLRRSSAGGMAAALNCSERSLIDLHKTIGMPGAAGLILGLALAARAARAETGSADPTVAEQVWMQPDENVQDIELDDD